MTSLQFLSQLIEHYGLYAVFFLVMIEGDITLLLAGVLAHSAFFGAASQSPAGETVTNSLGMQFVLVPRGSFDVVRDLGGVASDNCAYFAGRGFGQTARKFRFYRAAKERMQRLTNRFGALSIFLSKYIYGLRWASCTFYGVAHMPYARFLLLSAGSCFLWVLVLSGLGYFFSSAVMGLIGDFRRLGKLLLLIVVIGVLAVYLVKRYWVSKKVEEVEPDKLHEIEHAAIEGLKDLKDEIREKIHFK